MPEPQEISDDGTEADLVGLPQRTSSGARDPIEEAASLYLERLRAGETVDLDDFVQGYPKLEAELKDFLPLVAAMEDWKSEKELEVVKTPMPEQFDIERLGEFRIIREIARGGMGVVFEAEQESIGRHVAVKLLPWKFGAQSKWSKQFRREARIAARLQHPNIVPVFSFGEQDERFYYVMPIIEGVGFDHLISRLKTGESAVEIEDLLTEIRGPNFGRAAVYHRETPKQKRYFRRNNWVQVAKLATQITGALRFAHKQGTLHRDIKPANLLIDRSGKGWVADFGLALGRERAMSELRGPMAGTLRYMAPEQFEGIVNERTDLYSFGATLFELCTLQPAFDGQSRTELAAHVQRAKIISPRVLNPEIPHDLEAIILKLMKRNPEKRYQNADEVYRDLLRFINKYSASNRGLWSRFKDWF
ncbi:serine/threonine protein kinase [Thalassoglobus polymorphus]|uniref:Serine/threonine-protein kinase PrkC n=1 Tax=Thalassoglobus polymorphus TaxID=2527994 RepID=A0A517QR33_9PLAN|nr:serine/threonine-protein kinase [Thalassoglobus polymorphus]QDT34068.1 Serine/threonine-protein kinase PrkC [Thalassoglobus polymorphus]